MDTKKQKIIVTTLLIAAVFSLSCGQAFAATINAATPALDAKRENFRKQDEQRITQDKRKAAAEALKAERLKVYNAKQAVKQSQPSEIDNK